MDRFDIDQHHTFITRKYNESDYSGSPEIEDEVRSYLQTHYDLYRLFVEEYGLFSGGYSSSNLKSDLLRARQILEEL